MKNSIKVLAAFAAILSLVSCMEKGTRSSSTFTLGTTFEMYESDMPKYVVDSMMFSPTFSWEQITYFNSKSAELNQGYEGGFKFNIKHGWTQDTDDQAYFTSASNAAGAYDSNCYLGFLQTPTMPDYDIVFDYSGYYTANSQIIGCCINNTEYTMRLYEAGEIQDGDFLKVIIEFYNNNNLVGSLDKYLVDYVTTRELQIVKEWEDWEMAKEMQDKKITMGSFDSVKFRVETSSGKFVPCFCLDNFMIQLSVEF
ncbi:MAG: DUF4465 domain-containing protein [Bacteroidales bacterium]|nr:DUF4465 domain-containing protein [Bacteroidales bacterium]